MICATCHGAEGYSTNPMWPNLAGQHRSYIIKQLKDFKQGSVRDATIMAPMVATLTDKDMELIAEFYANKPINYTQSIDKRGEAIYLHGNIEKHIPACIACHGPKGTGNQAAGFPVIAGQQITYTINQLEAFKKGSRKNDLNGIMRDISSHMSSDDISAVARYIAGINNPR